MVREAGRENDPHQIRGESDALGRAGWRSHRKTPYWNLDAILNVGRSQPSPQKTITGHSRQERKRKGRPAI